MAQKKEFADFVSQNPIRCKQIELAKKQIDLRFEQIKSKTSKRNREDR